MLTIKTPILQQQKTAINKAVTRESIVELETILLDTPGVLIGNNDLNPLKHSFADGLYMREIFNPRGMCLTGKIHKYDHVAILLKGEMTVASEEGGIKNLQAPIAFISKAGTKRAIYCKTDCVFITVHKNPSNITNIEELENELLCDTYKEFDEWTDEVKQLSENSTGTKQLLSSSDIKNCGLLSFQQMIGEIKNISASTLIELAKDNKIQLYAYKIPLEEINDSLLPAIAHCENHYIFIDKGKYKQALAELKYTGVLLSSNQLSYQKVNEENLKFVSGGTAIAAGVLALAGAGAGLAGSIIGGNANKDVAAKNLAASQAQADAAKVAANDALEQTKLQIQLTQTQADAQAKKNKQIFTYVGIGLGGLALIGLLFWIFKN